MKHALLFIFLTLGASKAFSQKSYIQVSGEPNLSVYLDGELKGKTTVEYQGYIIDNVSPGAHIIKVVKDGYIPFQETITVKANEVFAYKVKPFSRQGVTISEQGNAASSEKKVDIPTGKLIIQSVPIEIKITIPQVEGLKDITKTKDQWTVSDISEGSYDLQLNFGSKSITKRINILGGFTTSVFVNMISGEFTLKDPFTAKKEKENTIQYFNSLMTTYGFKRGLTPSGFFANNPESAKLANYPKSMMDPLSGPEDWFFFPEKAILKNAQVTKGPRSLAVAKSGYVKVYSYCISSFTDKTTAQREMRTIVEKIKSETNSQYAGIFDNEAYTEFCPIGQNIRIRLDVTEIAKNRFEVVIYFLDDTWN
ncbi:PEGA domain-containing protein [Pedobacter sp. LMG 31464]|uniref:PEGA domain-containing protein n=1 Tax=Pedobacter planticolens TaxID=2679964 RepID=A0A923DXD2_9SPHI|nr:PEGA domain-containing protein [Pedobacter planticolens]MBB2144806.1 PEGA domain-containing protein [Pedobacter planticolens]